MSNKRYVLDTNTLVSGVSFTNSKPAAALEKATNGGFLFVSDETIDELSDVLRREKFDKYVSLEKRLNFLYDYISSCLKSSNQKQSP